ncbi:hypothetical protein ACA910_010963 [Epithemia clementina (nom. ined.)]
MQRDTLKPASWKAKGRMGKKRRRLLPNLIRNEQRNRTGQQAPKEEVPPIIQQFTRSDGRVDQELDDDDDDSCSSTATAGDKEDEDRADEDGPPPTKKHRSSMEEIKKNNQTTGYEKEDANRNVTTTERLQEEQKDNATVTSNKTGNEGSMAQNNRGNASTPQ